MLYDQGASVPLSIVAENSSDVPTDTTTVICTVTLPDGTTSTPTVSHDGTGLYSALFVTTLVGRHVVRWTSGFGPYTDVFNVVAVDPGWIVGLNDAKTFLQNNGLSGPEDDQRLRDFVGYASKTIAWHCGDVAPTTYDEWYDGGSTSIALVHYPLASVTSVTETFGANVIRALTEQVLDGLSPVDAYGFTVDLVSGFVIRRVSGLAAPFALGERNVHVVYKTGHTDALPDLIAGCLELIRYTWAQSQGAGGVLGVGPITDFSALPNIVQNKIGRWRRGPGIG